MMRTRILFIVLLFFSSSAYFVSREISGEKNGQSTAHKNAVKSADWVKETIIYSVYLRSFSPEGTFAGLEKRIPELKEMGVNVIWLMPIHPIGIKNRKGKLGSPYSIRDYYDTNPEFGSMLDFQKLLTTAHKNKIKLILDLVINHTSWDSKLIQQHPEWFSKNSLGNIISPNDDWTDVADLDYSKPGLRKYMLDMMEWWVKDIGIDGFRCDVSELVPLDFWEEARNKLNKIKPIMMLSEGSLPEHHLNAFDITYSWNIYDALEPLLKNERSAKFLDTLFQKEKSEFPINSLRLRFNTNHDKNAWDEPAILKFGKVGLKLSAVIINTIPGIPLIYNGEEVANDQKLGLFEKVDIDWNRSREMDTLYRSLFKLRKVHKAISHGEFIKASTSDDTNIFAFLRIEGKDKILVILNFSDALRTPKIKLAFDKSIGEASKIMLKDYFTHNSIQVEKGKIFNPSIQPFGYQIYLVSEK
ncbi:MAG: alpha-amylase [Ignavibacteriales bacterium]|nr:alpha-amylase [Ignavibacteriales bacterium]